MQSAAILHDNYRAAAQAIAFEYHVTVDAALTAYDIKVPSGGGGNVNGLYSNITSLPAAYEMQKYLREGMSSKEVAFKFGATPDLITATMAAHGMSVQIKRGLPAEVIAECARLYREAGVSIRQMSKQHHCSPNYLSKEISKHEGGK